MIEIIPAIDLIDGKCVRLEQGDYNHKTIYHDNPLDMAKLFEDNGIGRLHLVDLDGAKSGHVINLPVLESICSNTKLSVDFGGGIKKDSDIDAVFEAGAELVTLGSVAVKNTEKYQEWIKKYGPDKIILGADVKDKQIAISGWMEITSIDLFDFLKTHKSIGTLNILCTDISKDGMLLGTSLNLYREIKKQFPDFYLIASGGVTSMKDIISLDELGIDAVVIGKALYENKISLEEISTYMA